MILFEKIYIHIGLPKTGSTAIQNCMEELSRAGKLRAVSYPVLGAERGEQLIQSGNGAAIAKILAPDITPSFCASHLQDAFAALVDTADSSRKVLLISSEIFSSASAERVKYFKELLFEKSKNIELIICARPLNEMCYSHYHQAVKRHGYSLGYGCDWFSQFINESLFPRLQSVDQWDVTGSVLEYKKDQLLHDFLALIGEDVRLAHPLEGQRINRSLTQEELILLLQINAVFQSEPLSMRISDSWIHARPQLLSMESLHDTAALLALFHQKYSSLKGSIKGDAVKEVIAIIGSGGEDESTLSNNGQVKTSIDSAFQSDHLIPVALGEIKKFMNLEADLGAYTCQLNSTREAFEPIHYLLLNRDVLATGVDPVVHYREFGKAEGRPSAFNLTSMPWGKL